MDIIIDRVIISTRINQNKLEACSIKTKYIYIHIKTEYNEINCNLSCFLINFFNDLWISYLFLDKFKLYANVIFCIDKWFAKLISHYINVDRDIAPLMSPRLRADMKMNFDKKKAFSKRLTALLRAQLARMINWADTLFNWSSWSVSSWLLLMARRRWR